MQRRDLWVMIRLTLRRGYRDTKKERQISVLELCWCTFGEMYHTTGAQTDSCLHYKHRLCGGRWMAEENPGKQNCLFHNSTSEMMPQWGQINRWQKSCCSFHYLCSSSVPRSVCCIISLHIMFLNQLYSTHAQWTSSDQPGLHVWSVKRQLWQVTWAFSSTYKRLVKIISVWAESCSFALLFGCCCALSGQFVSL